MLKSILIILTLIMILTACKSESDMNIEQPNYYIKLNMHGCIRVITVNGIEVESDFDGHSNTAEIPINHLIQNGSNEFQLIVPDQETVEENWTVNTTCSVEVRVSGGVNGKSVDFKVGDIVFTPNYSQPRTNLYKQSMRAGNYKFDNLKTVLFEKSTDSVLGEIRQLPAYEEGMGGVFTRTFKAQVPFKRWAFFDADVLFDGYYPLESDKQYDAAEDSIWPEVEKLWNLFESQEVDKILPLFKLRSDEYDQAYYRESGSTLNQLKNSLNNVYSNKYPLNRKSRDNMQMVVSYGSNLVTVVNAATYNGTVMFYDHTSDSNTFYTVYWMKKDGKWIIAR